MLPFTVDQFLEVFRRYNEGVWPAQSVLATLAVLSVIAAIDGGERASRFVAGALSLFWIWTGIVYHLFFFRSINPAATAFAIFFVIEGILIARFGVYHPRLRFQVTRDWKGVIGGTLIFYALVVYPLLGPVLGHRYPAAPTFGAPCPTAIFTLGLLVWTKGPWSKMVVVIPALWAAVAFTAATRFGMWEDLGLVVAACIALATTLTDRQRLASGRTEPLVARESSKHHAVWSHRI